MRSFELLNFINTTRYSTFMFTWNVIDSMADRHNYSFSIFSQINTSNTIVVDATFIKLTLLFNIEYTVNITAITCIGEKIILNQFVILVQCPDPTILPGIKVISYSNQLYQGSVLMYQCADDVISKESLQAICGSNMTWHPVIISCIAGRLCFKKLFHLQLLNSFIH